MTTPSAHSRRPTGRSGAGRMGRRALSRSHSVRLIAERDMCDSPPSDVSLRLQQGPALLMHARGQAVFIRPTILACRGCRLFALAGCQSYANCWVLVMDWTSDTDFLDSRYLSRLWSCHRTSHMPVGANDAQHLRPGQAAHATGRRLVEGAACAKPAAPSSAQKLEKDKAPSPYSVCASIALSPGCHRCPSTLAGQ